MHLYTVTIYIDDMIMDMCPCLLVVVASVLCHWLGIFHL